MYIYKAIIVAVYDGDTVRADIDLGFGIIIKNVALRLYGINAPEMRGDTIAAGTAARDVLRTMILNRDVVLKTYKDRQEKYGRYLAEIEIGDIQVNQWLVKNGYAVAATY